MGRLDACNLEQKKPVKNIEAGYVHPQNESKDNVEIAELLVVIEKKKAAINYLRLAVVCLSLIIGCLILYLTLFNYPLLQDDTNSQDQSVSNSDFVNKLQMMVQQLDMHQSYQELNRQCSKTRYNLEKEIDILKNERTLLLSQIQRMEPDSWSRSLIVSSTTPKSSETHRPLDNDDTMVRIMQDNF